MKKLFLILIIVILSFTVAPSTHGEDASLYLSPSAGTYTVGNTFLVQVKVNTGEVAINAADGTLVFDPDKLEVKSLSKEDSIFTLWVQEPIFSNSLGTINFAGGKPSPGFTGAAGTIININLKAKTSGTANLTFAAGSVLADDGKGTNILTLMGSGVYKLVTREITPIPPTEEEIVPPITPGQAPAAPVISSSTHPDENKWYSNNNPEFTWKLPSDVTGVSLYLSKSLTSNPGPVSDGLMESKKYEDVEDGTWYFHIKFQNQYGWGEITHRKVLIDTVPPLPFEIKVQQREDPTDPQPVLLFETTDELSGVEYYEAKIGEGEPLPLNSSYKLPPQAPGKHTIQVKAFDKAENYTLAATEIEILPIEPPPKITKIPISIRIGETLEIEGEALPEITVRIYIQKLDKEPILEKVQADSEGKFVLTYDKPLAKGDYLIWAQSEDERGALSYPTKKYSLEVGLPPFLKIGKIVIDYLTTMITLIILIVGAIAVIFYTWYRISLWRKRLRVETKEIAQAVYRAFKVLRGEVEEQIEYFDKKPGLTEKEKAIRDKLQEALDISEKSIKKEIKDIEKELK